MNGWVSPRLGVRFEPGPDTLRLVGPDGRPFATDAELNGEQLARELAQERLRSKRLHEQLRALGVEPEDV